MTVRVYRSTDASAPVLTGQAGSLVALLDACLVNGFGALAAAGWTKPYTGTNKAAFRNNSTTGTGMYLRVDDNVTSYFHRAYVTGYETMTGIDAGTNGIPASHTLNYSGWGKSNTQDATARPWVIIADEFRFYIAIQTGESGSDWSINFCGDIISYKPTDAYRFGLSSRYSGSGANYFYNSLDYLPFMYNNGSTFGGSTGFTMVRDHLGSGNPRQCGLHTDSYKAVPNNANIYSFYTGTYGLTYPSAVNNGVFIAPIWVHHSPVVRGHLPGLWAPLHNRGPANGDTFSGTGALAGKTFEVFNCYSVGQLVIETSDTWS
jgi:hypothetical protein